MKAGANLNAASKYGETPLHRAAQKGHREVVAALVKAGADLNLVDEDNLTPMYRAALSITTGSEKQHAVIVMDLVEAGADQRHGRTTCSPRRRSSIYLSTRLQISVQKFSRFATSYRLKLGGGRKQQLQSRSMMTSSGKS